MTEKTNLATWMERVRAETLEECARIAELQPFHPDTHTGTRQLWLKQQIAAKIRARSNQPGLPLADREARLMAELDELRRGRDGGT